MPVNGIKKSGPWLEFFQEYGQNRAKSYRRINTSDRQVDTFNIKQSNYY